MNCRKCGSELAAGSKFCSACGAACEEEKKPQALYCRKCGSKLAAGSKFCPACGAACEEGKKPQAPHSTERGSAFAASSNSAPPVEQRGKRPVQDKICRRLNVATTVCVLFGILLSRYAGSLADSSYHHSMGLKDIEELSNQITMFNVLAIVMCLAGIILAFVSYFYSKKKEGGR